MEKIFFSSDPKVKIKAKVKDINALIGLMNQFVKEAGDGKILPKDNAWLIERLRGINDELLKHL